MDWVLGPDLRPKLSLSKPSLGLVCEMLSLHSEVCMLDDESKLPNWDDKRRRSLSVGNIKQPPR
jgi:hypothetical protein